MKNLKLTHIFVTFIITFICIIIFSKTIGKYERVLTDDKIEKVILKTKDNTGSVDIEFYLMNYDSLIDVTNKSTIVKVCKESLSHATNGLKFPSSMKLQKTHFVHLRENNVEISLHVEASNVYGVYDIVIHILKFNTKGDLINIETF